MAAQVDLSVSDLLRALPTDASQPVLQGANPPVGYDFWTEHNGIGYADRQGFEGYALQFADETKGIVELEAIDRWAKDLASMLYCYRSIARALPTVTGSDEGRKKAMYSASFEVLHPAIQRVKVMITFKERACTKWISNLSLLVRAENKSRVDKKGEAPIPCEALYFQLLHTLGEPLASSAPLFCSSPPLLSRLSPFLHLLSSHADMLAVLDATLDTKACLNNDFSAYKRAFAHCRSDIPDAELITNENGLLQPFLAVPQTLLTALRVATHKIPGFDTVLADMATLAIESLENDWCADTRLHFLPLSRLLTSSQLLASCCSRDHRRRLTHRPSSALARTLAGICCRTRSIDSSAAPRTRYGCSTRQRRRKESTRSRTSASSASASASGSAATPSCQCTATCSQTCSTSSRAAQTGRTARMPTISSPSLAKTSPRWPSTTTCPASCQPCACRSPPSAPPSPRCSSESRSRAAARAACCHAPSTPRSLSRCATRRCGAAASCRSSRACCARRWSTSATTLARRICSGSAARAPR